MLIKTHDYDFRSVSDKKINFNILLIWRETDVLRLPTTELQHAAGKKEGSQGREGRKKAGSSHQRKIASVHKGNFNRKSVTSDIKCNHKDMYTLRVHVPCVITMNMGSLGGVAKLI